METKDPAPGGGRVTVPSAARAAEKWERRRDHTPSETGVLRDAETRPTSITALRRALAQFQDRSHRIEDLLRQLADKLDHIHEDARALRDKLGLWREACGGPRPAPARRAPEKKRRRATAARARRR